VSEGNKETIRRIREEAVGRSGAALDLLDGLYAPNYRYHGGAAFGEMTGPDAFKLLLQGMSSVLEGYREQVVDQVEEGNRVATRLVGQGKVVGELLGFPGKGASMTGTAFSLAVFNDAGQIEEEWVEADTYGMLKQIGGL
jgi:predicted ester cyclase